jgi:hypothetical protein
MGQVSWRMSDELLERVRETARAYGWSVNMYVTTVMDAATDPAHAGSETERIRERLDRAGLLAVPGPPVRRPPRAAVQRSAKAAATGTPLSELLSADRE